MSKRLLAATMAALAIGAAAIPAGAQDGAKPVPCNGMLAKDEPGDASVGFADLFYTGIPSGENTDGLGYFVNSTDGETTVNFVLANASKDEPVYSLGVIYRFFYSTPKSDRYIEARVSGGEVTADYGHIDTTLVSDGSTKAKLYEGKEGVLSVVVPAVDGGNEKMSGAYLLIATDEGAIIASTDRVPDTGESKWDGATCAGGLPTVTSAKIAAKGKKATLTLSASKPVTGISAQLVQGGKAVAKGKAAKIDGSGVLKMKGKGIKPGAATLKLTGTSDGKPVSGEIALTLS